MNQKRLILTFDIENAFSNNCAWLEEITSNLLVLLKEHNSKATFFIVGDVAEKTLLVEKIFKEGHEIACHGGYTHTSLENSTIAEFSQEIKRSLELIENITGERPIGFRAPFFSLNSKTKWVLKILRDFGFRYDSSIFPINTGYYGISGLPLGMYKISENNLARENKNSNILEIPPAVFNWHKIKFPIGGGIYFRFMPFIVFNKLLLSVMKKRKPVLYFHPHDFNKGYKQILKSRQNRTLLDKFFLDTFRSIGVNSAFTKLKKILVKYRSDSVKNTLELGQYEN